LEEICDRINSGEEKSKKLENKEREKETEEGDGGGRWERAEEEETPAKSRSIGYRFFFALALTRLSNTVLRMGVCAVWNGFMAVWKSLNIRRKTTGGHGP
jgi:hypothetical protein